MTDAPIVKSNGGAIEREGFHEIERRNETGSTSLAVQARAEIEAAYVMAMQRPRDDDNVRARLLKACARPEFAKHAFYSVPRRGAEAGRITGAPERVEGLSVRFAEEAIRCSGNIRQRTRTAYDDDFKRMVNVAAIDLETNAIYDRDVIVEKTKERSKVFDGQVVLAQRTNTGGKTVFIVQTTEEDLLVKESALIARVFRTLCLKLVPPDTRAECERKIIETIRKSDAADPDAARKEIADAFARLNVMPAELKEYLGHELGACSPKELETLRGVYAAIADGEVTWPEVLAEKRGPVVEGKGEPAKDGAKPSEKIAARVKARASKANAEKAKPNAEQGPAAPAPAGPVCMTCNKPIEGVQPVSTTNRDGEVGMRHPDCKPASEA